MYNVQISSERLYLRELSPDDLKSVAKYARKPEVTKYLTWECQTLDDVQSWLNSRLQDQHRSPRTEYELAIILRESQQLIGTVNMTLDIGNKCAEIGYILSHQYRNRGYAIEAVRALISHGFSHLQLHRFFAISDVQNIVSHSLLLKAGFLKEGVLREHLWVKGKWRSSAIFGLLREP